MVNLLGQHIIHSIVVLTDGVWLLCPGLLCAAFLAIHGYTRTAFEQSAAPLVVPTTKWIVERLALMVLICAFT